MGFVSHAVKKVAKVAAPYIAPIAALSGVGLPLAAGLGAATGFLSGGGLKGALLGGASGALGAGGGSILGGALNSAGGLGLSAAGAGALGGGLGGAAIGGLSGGGLKGALLGGGLGAAGGYIQGSGGLGNAFDNIKGDLGFAGDAASGAANAAGSAGLSGSTNGLNGAGNGVTGTISGASSGGAVATGGGSSAFLDPSQSKDLLGGLSGINGVADSAVPSSVASASSAPSFLSNLGDKLTSANAIVPLASGAINTAATMSGQNALLKSQDAANAQLAPYLQSGRANNQRLSELLGTGGDPNSADYGSLSKPFDPTQIAQDPGYQFELDQGTQALNRSLGAKGQVFSGAALKGAADYATGLASQNVNDAYNRDLQTKQQLYNSYAGQSAAGQTAANSGAQIQNNIGNTNANADVSLGNTASSSLAGLLQGSGAIIGYSNGVPIYANDKTASSYK